jgi:hypothetical protein
VRGNSALALSADGADHLVQELQGDTQPFENVRAFAGFAKLEARAPRNTSKRCSI